MGKYVDKAISGFKYLLALFMMYAGVATVFFVPVSEMGGALGIIYDYKISLVILGIIFFLSGLSLLYGKIKRSRVWTGRGLMSIYLSFLFAALLQIAAFPTDPVQWAGNLIAALICGLLWLRWKFKVSYWNPKHFVDVYEPKGK